MVVLEGPVVEGGAVGVDMPVLADGGDALAFVGMAEMGEDETDLGEPSGDLVEVAGEGEFEGGLGDEGGPGVEEDGEAVASGVGPEVVKLTVLRVEAGVHGHELDALEFEGLMTVGEFIAPVGLGGVEGEEADEAVGMEGDVGGDFVIGDPEAGEFGFAAEDNGFVAEGGTGAVGVVVNGEVDFLIAAGVAGLRFEVVGEVAGVFPEVAMDVDDHGGRIADWEEQLDIRWRLTCS